MAVACALAAILSTAACSGDAAPSAAGPVAVPTTNTSTTTAPAAEVGTVEPPAEPELVRTWSQVSAATDDLLIPPGGSDQTALLAGDLDDDGSQDLVLGSRKGRNSVAWYRNGPDGWDVVSVEPEGLAIEAGGDLHDVDGDGYLDIVLGGDFSSKSIWWWRNPGPDGWDERWERFELKRTGPVRHHDLGFGDFDGDGAGELAFWNQGPQGKPVHQLFVAEIPADPTAGEWPRTLVHTAGRPSEGMAIADIDGDGADDIVTSDGWLHLEGTELVHEAFESATGAGQVAAGDLVAGGRPEIVIASGDEVDGLDLYQWVDGAWAVSDLLSAQLPGPWRNGHTLDIGDVDQDGNLDIFTAEMALAAEADARSVVLLGDGDGGFALQTVSTGDDNHESLLVDVDGDGDLDIASKPFNDGTPALSFWHNELGPAIGAPGSAQPTPAGAAVLDQWARHQVGTRSDRSLFVHSGDVDGDGDLDVITGANWFENPGTLSGGWTTHDIGRPLTDAVVVEDLDGDGDVDIFGTQGHAFRGASHKFAWASNDGTGTFSVHTNVDQARKGFLQGGTSVRFSPDGPLEIWLSWNDRSRGVQRIVVPTDPERTRWRLEEGTDVSQGEEIAFADIDRDGDLDLLEGHIWMRNDGGARTWTRFDLHQPTQCCFAGQPEEGDRVPDRVAAADINGDGRVDSMVSHEYDLTHSVAWYEQPEDPTELWTEHIVTSELGFPIHSLDVADLDGDGDVDVAAAQYDVDDPDNGDAWVLENADGPGGDWVRHLVHSGDQNHDGMQLADLDGDGDLDVFSIGWNQDRVVVYENLAQS